MRFMRITLIVTILLLAYTAGIVFYMYPVALMLPAALAAAAIRRNGNPLTSHGSARWADASDIPHYLE